MLLPEAAGPSMADDGMEHSLAAELLDEGDLFSEARGNWFRYRRYL